MSFCLLFFGARLKALFKVFPRAKARHSALGDHQARACFWVAAHTSFPEALVKGAKTDKLDLFALADGSFNNFQSGV